MEKSTTACCALCQISKVGNSTPIENLRAAVRLLREQKEANTEVGITTGNGQTAVFVIVSPGENILERNLKKLKFRNAHTFERRVGYPALGDLKMYIKNL